MNTVFEQLESTEELLRQAERNLRELESSRKLQQVIEKIDSIGLRYEYVRRDLIQQKKRILSTLVEFALRIGELKYEISDNPSVKYTIQDANFVIETPSFMIVSLEEIVTKAERFSFFRFCDQLTARLVHFLKTAAPQQGKEVEAVVRVVKELCEEVKSKSSD